MLQCEEGINIIEVIEILSVLEVLPIVLEIEEETFFTGNSVPHAWSSLLFYR